MVKGSGSGLRLHPKGYLQYIRRGPFRFWLEHRRIMFAAAQEFCYYEVDDRLPAWLTVDHIDHSRAHNCRQNLLLLDKRIHDAISTAHRWFVERTRGDSLPPARTPDWFPGVPDWVNEP